MARQLLNNGTVMPNPDPSADQSLRIAPSLGSAGSGVRIQPSRRQSLVTWADKAVMDGCCWRQQTLDGHDFQGANLRDATFQGCSLAGCDFSGSDLRGARFIDCDLRRANLDGASLAGAVFPGTWLTGAQGLSAVDRTRIRRAGGRFLIAV
jgi:uncharacterized protein YjbI with pentapeptide repeats